MCGAKNCCRQNGSVYTDVLLRPELLKAVKGGGESSSSNPLLEFCLDGGLGDKKPQPPLPPPQQHFSSSSAFSTLWFSSSAAESFEKSPQPPPKDDSALHLALLLNPLLRICSKRPFGREESEELKAILGVGEGGSANKLIGCDNKQIHATGPKGRTAMHFLISGCTRETFPHVLDSIYQLLGFGFDLRRTDTAGAGDTALTAVRALLDRQLFHEAHLLTLLFLQAGSSDINHANAAGRTLLSHAVEHGDRTINTSRLLINHGAMVWPNNGGEGTSTSSSSASIVDRLAAERERSAFTWFLRSVMEEGGGLAGRAETLSLLSHAMGDEPVRMQAHVMRVMMHLGHSRLALGPVFNEVRAKMAPFWTRPQRLGYLCLRQVRKSIGPKKLSEDRLLLETLNIPNTMLSYLQLA